MKLSAKTIDILKSLKDINPSILIKRDYVPPYVDLKGNTIIGVVSSTSRIMAFARIEEVFDHDIAIHDGGKFLATLSLFKDAEVQTSETRITISAGDSHVDFTFCSPEAIISPPAEWVDKKTGRNLKPSYDDGSFILHQSHIAELLRMSGVLAAPDILFEGDGEVVRVTATNEKNPSSNKYTAVLDSCATEFKVYHKIDVLKLFPANYTVSMVAGNSTKPLRFTNEDFEIYIAPLSEKERERERAQ